LAYSRDRYRLFLIIHELYGLSEAKPIDSDEKAEKIEEIVN